MGAVFGPSQSLYHYSLFGNILREARSKSLHLKVQETAKYRSVFQSLHPSVAMPMLKHLQLCDRKEISCQMLQRLRPACFFLSAEPALLNNRPGTVCSGSWQSSATSHRAHCLQSMGSICCATRHTEPGCNVHTHLTWKHKQISSTSRSKRLEEFIFGFIPFLLARLRQGSYHPGVTCHQKWAYCISSVHAACWLGWFFCELMRLNNTGRHQNCCSPLFE